jgi:hypothetical protein
LQQFDNLAEEFHFDVIDARPEPKVIFEQLREGILRVLVRSDGAPSPALSIVPPAAAAEPADPSADVPMHPLRRSSDAAARPEETRAKP